MVKLLWNCLKCGRPGSRLLLSFHGEYQSARGKFLVGWWAPSTLLIHMVWDVHWWREAFGRLGYHFCPLMAMQRWGSPFCRITLISAELQWSLVTFKSSEISLGISPSLWPLLSRIWTKASCSGLGKGQGKDYHSFSLISILSSRVAGSFVHRTG